MARASSFHDLAGDQHSVEEQLGSRPGRWIPLQSSRVSQARYDPGLQQIHVIFVDGTPWTYDSVPRNIWNNFRRSNSPGKYINRTLNNFPYWEGSFDAADTFGGE